METISPLWVLPICCCLPLLSFSCLLHKPKLKALKAPSQRITYGSATGALKGTLLCATPLPELFRRIVQFWRSSSEEKIVLMGVREASIQKVLKPHIPDITDLNIQSANFLAMNQLFLLGNGVISAKGKGPGGSTPLLALSMGHH